MCVWHLILHTSSICPGYSVTPYLCCIPCAYLSWVSAPNPVAGWSIVWCHLSYISAFLQALAEFSELCSDAKFLCIFYHSLCFGEIIFADSSISWPSEGKVYVYLYHSSVPLTIDYVSIPVPIAQYFEGPAFYLGLMNHRANSLLLCISFYVRVFCVLFNLYQQWSINPVLSVLNLPFVFCQGTLQHVNSS